MRCLIAEINGETHVGNVGHILEAREVDAHIELRSMPGTTSAFAVAEFFDAVFLHCSRADEPSWQWNPNRICWLAE